jgi:hypothetical protein
VDGPPRFAHEPVRSSDSSAKLVANGPALGQDVPRKFPASKCPRDFLRRGSMYVSGREISSIDWVLLRYSYKYGTRSNFVSVQSARVHI